MKQLNLMGRVARLLAFALMWVLAACASSVGGQGVTQGKDYFPGGTPTYGWGVSQRIENFANVDQAQVYFGIFTSQRSWEPITVSGIRANARTFGLYAYYPMDVRWKLKNGIEFMLEKIDIRAIMQEYFKTHDIQLQWQKEKRPKADVGDYWAVLATEIKDDAVLIKWVVKTNHTPVSQRLTTTGAATAWVITDEEYLVTAIKGIPVSGIDFEKWLEIRK